MLEVTSLSCRRGGRLIFRDLGFRAPPGALLQITGANGSGKSTLLRVLAGLLPSAEGEILWRGAPVADDPDAHRARLNYLGHLDALKPELTGHETLDYWRALRPSAAPFGDDFFGIGRFLHKPVRMLSAGQKRRLALTRLALDGAAIWLLDEPTTALDVEGQAMLSAAIAAHRAKGGIAAAAVHHAFDAPDVRTFAMPEAR
jgi:heme exporter protein A